MKSGQYTREIPQRYRMEAAKCDGCGKIRFPPRLVCNECRGRDFTVTVLPKKGRLLHLRISMSDHQIFRCRNHIQWR